MRCDVKGLYAQALRGEITNFTGASDPYEPPVNPEVTIYRLRRACVALEARGYLSPSHPEVANTRIVVGLEVSR